MTFVGKLFTVLILICSIFLTAVAVMLAASQQNWKEQAMENKSQAEASRQLLAASRTQVDEAKAALERERVTSRLALQRVQVQLLVEQSKAEQSETELATLRAESGRLRELVKQNEDRLKELGEANLALRNTANELTTTLHTTLTRVTSLTDTNFKLEGEISRLGERSGQLANDVAQIEKVMTAYGLDRNSLTAHIPPQVEGRITAVSSTVKGLVELSLGEDDGVRVGHRMDVFRGGKYLGAVIVKSVTDNSATAEIVPELNEAPIREDDRVTTQLDSQLRG